MMSKSVTSLAFAAGCVLALGAMPSAQAQNYPPPQPQPYVGQPMQPYAGQQQIQMPAYNGAPQTQAYTAPPPAPMGPPPATWEPTAQAAPMPTQLETNGPQASRGDFGDWSARRNVIESAHYDRLLQTNIAFRHARMRKECGPIGDPQLHQQCMASFQQFEPVMYGSSLPPRHWRHHRGAGY